MSFWENKKNIKKAKEAFFNLNYELCIFYYEKVGIANLNYEDLEQLGLSYLFLEKMYQAKAIFKMLEEEVANLTIFNCLFVIAEWEGKTEEVEYYIQKGLDFPEENANFYFSCALYYDRNQDITNAKKYYLKTLSLDENHYWANVNLGSFYENENKNDEALVLFLKAKKVMPEESCASYNLGVVYTKLTNYKLALEYYQDELTKKEPYLKTYSNLGLLYMNNFKDYKKAQEIFLQGLKVYPDEYELWYNLACLYALMKDYKNATDCFKIVKYKDQHLSTLIATDPDLEEYRKSYEYQEIIK